MTSTMRLRRRSRTWGAKVGAAVLVYGAAVVWAGSLGAPALDSFLTQFQAGVIGLGVVLFAIGGASWLNQKMDLIHMPALSGTMSWIIPGGLFGSVIAIATAIGLTAAGGTLPL